MVELRRKGHTRISEENGNTRVSLWDTDIVRANKREIELNSGGWYTPTTKRRMNQASEELGLGYNVYQEDKEWFVSHRGQTRKFKSGMRLNR
jgi:hypothetical protein